MVLFVLEKGTDYNFLVKLDPRYALRMSSLLDTRFGRLEEIIEAAKKVGLNEDKFYIPGLELNAISPKDLSAVYVPQELSIFYLIARSGKEAAKIKAIE